MRAPRVLAVLCAAFCCLTATTDAARPARKGHAGRHQRACHGRHHRHRCPVDHSSHKQPVSVNKKAAGGTTSSGPQGSWGSVPEAVAPVSVETPATGGGAGSGESGEAPVSSGPAHVQVTAEDGEHFRFVLSRASVPAGKVTIEFVNHGQDEHNLNALEATEGVDAGGIPNTAPGAHPSITLEMRKGSYTLFCSLPGHEAKGMKATLQVE